MSSSSTRRSRAEEEEVTGLIKWVSADTWHKCDAIEQMPCGQNARRLVVGKCGDLDAETEAVCGAEKRHTQLPTTMAFFVEVTGSFPAIAARLGYTFLVPRLDFKDIINFVDSMT